MNYILKSKLPFQCFIDQNTSSRSNIIVALAFTAVFVIYIGEFKISNDEKSKAELNEKVNPMNVKMANVEKRKNGSLVIQSENVEEKRSFSNSN